MEKEPVPHFTVTEMQSADVEPATIMRLQSWLDTYTNPDAGVSREWIEERNKEQLSAAKTQSRIERFVAGKAQGVFNGWVARDDDGNIIGSTTPYIDEDGSRHLGSLYVAKEWHGTGVGHALMQQAMDWLGDEHPIELGVVTYNERAKAFYRKWGFEEVPNAESLFDGVMPEIKMIRKVVR